MRLRSETCCQVLLIALIAAGCGGGGGGDNSGGLVGPRIQTIKGVVRGGDSPICNSFVSLVGAGLQSVCGSTTTDSQGQFKLTLSSCGARPTTEMYLFAFGGVPNTNDCSMSNNALELSATLGPLRNLDDTSVTVNEVTTVASVWALNQFLSSDGETLDDHGNPTGLANAAMAVTSKNLVDTATGRAPDSFGAGVLSPTQKLYTLADVLATCAQSTSASSPQCQQLLCLAFPGATFSGNCSALGLNTTLEAAISIARNPVNNVTALFNLVTQPPFQPVLELPPTDWLLAVTYQGIGGLSSPAYVAIDAGGNVWTTNSAHDSVTKLSPVGSALSPGSGFLGGLFEPQNIAIDSAGNAWISSLNRPHTVTILGSNGVPTRVSPVRVDKGFGVPGLAINSQGQVWVANSDGTLAVINSAGSLIGAFSSQIGSFAVAIGAADGVWIAGGASLAGLTSFGNPLDGSPFSGGGLGLSRDVAVDASGNVWVVNQVNQIAKFDSSGSPLSAAGFTGGGLSAPNGIAIDGAGKVWIANNGSPSITELSSSGIALSPGTGFTDPNLSFSLHDAVDASGNLWVTNHSGRSVTEFIGAAAPVKTPLIGPAHAP